MNNSNIAQALYDIAQNTQVSQSGRMVNDGKLTLDTGVGTRPPDSPYCIAFAEVYQAKIQFCAEFTKHKNYPPDLNIKERLALVMGNHIYGDLARQVKKMMARGRYEIKNRLASPTSFYDPVTAFDAYDEVFKNVDALLNTYTRDFETRTLHISEVTPAMAINWIFANFGIELSLDTHGCGYILTELENLVIFKRDNLKEDSSQKLFNVVL